MFDHQNIKSLQNNPGNGFLFIYYLKTLNELLFKPWNSI